MLNADDLEAARTEAGRKLRELREAKGYSPDFFAGICDINSETLRRYEIGERSPSRETLMVFAAMLGVSTDELMADDYRSRFGPGKVLAALDLAAGSARGDSNSARPGRRSAKRREQQGRKSARQSREGGIPTTPVRPARTLPEVA